MDLTFNIFHATIPRVRYVAITPVPRFPQIAPSLLRDLRDPRVKIPTPPVLPTLRAHRPTHSLPSFSTPSKHGPHTKTRKPFPLYCLLHTSLYTGENGRSRPHPVPSPPVATPFGGPPSAHNSFKCNAYKKQGVCISTSPAIAPELSTRDNPNPSVPVFLFDSRLSVEDPGPVGTVDLFC